MARARGNAALIEQENLSKEEQAQMDENRAAEAQPELPIEESKQPEAPKPPEEPKPAEAAPAAPAAPDGASPGVPADDKKRMVEYGALHEERERRKQEQARAQKAEQELARLSGRFSTLEELARAAAAEQQPKPKSPDVGTDPVGHFQHEIALRDQKLAQFENWAREQQRAAQQQQEIAFVRQRAMSEEQEFAKATPDYVEAAEYVQRIRNAQLEAVGFTDPLARSQQLAMEALNLAVVSAQRGENAAATIYRMAKASGWTPKAAAQSGAAAGSGSQQHDPAGAKKLETVARGQQANTSIGKLNGQTAPNEPTLEDLLKMSEKDFAAWSSKGDNWRKIFAS
jgi:hypothetical protein